MSGSQVTEAVVGQTVRLCGGSANQEREVAAILGGAFQVVSGSEAQARTVVLDIPDDVVIEAAWLLPLLNHCVSTGDAACVGLVDEAGAIHHAGGALVDEAVRPFGHGANRADSAAFTVDRRTAPLLAPRAMWSEPQTAAAAPTGTFLGGLWATATTPVEPVANLLPVRVADAFGAAILVDGSSGDRSVDSEVVRAAASRANVFWRLPSIDTSLGVDPLPGGVALFDARSHEVDSLAAAFDVSLVLHLDDDTPVDGIATQHLLRARPGIPRLLLSGHGRPGANARCDGDFDVSEVAGIVDGLAERPKPLADIGEVAEADTRQGVTSIVIPVHGLWDMTARCMDSIRAHTSAPVEIVVVDDASPDDTADRLAELEDVVVVTNDRNLGFPKSVNAGIEVASGEFVCVLNNDVEVTDGWLDEMASVLATPGTVLVGPRSNSISGLQNVADAPPLSDNTKAHAWARSWTGLRAGEAWTTNRLVGFCLLARRSTFVEHGAFDEAFGTGNFEDDELGDRLRKAGGELKVADGAVVLHHGSATFASMGVDYVSVLATAARNHQAVDAVRRGPIAVLVLSDGDAAATEQTVWSVLGLSHCVCVADRSAPDTVALALARAERLGVEVFQADWTTSAGAEAALTRLENFDRVLVVSSGEVLAVADWGGARSEMEKVSEATAAVAVDGEPQVRIHRPTAELMQQIGQPAEAAIAGMVIHCASSRAVPDQAPSTGSAGSTGGPDAGPIVDQPLVLVLRDGLAEDWAASVASAFAFSDAVAVLDRSIDPSDDGTVPVVGLDWTEPGQLAEFFEAAQADHVLVLAAGERLVVDRAGWAADRCIHRSEPLAVPVGDHPEVRLARGEPASIPLIGQQPESDSVSLGLRIVPAGFEHGDVLALRFPEIATHTSVALVAEGDPATCEKLAEAVTIDAELLTLERARADRPIDWSLAPSANEVGAVVAYDPASGLTEAELNTTVGSLLEQTHRLADIVVATPAGVSLPGSMANLVRQVEHTGLLDDDPADARGARLVNLATSLARGEWIAVCDVGDTFAADHVEHLLAVAYQDRSEYVHGIVAAIAPDGTVSLDLGADRQRHSGGFGPLLYAAQYRGLLLRPTAHLGGSSAGSNRVDRLRVLGVFESSAEATTVASQRV